MLFKNSLISIQWKGLIMPYQSWDYENLCRPITIWKQSWIQEQPRVHVGLMG